jgi:hypothetical protein
VENGFKRSKLEAGEPISRLLQQSRGAMKRRSTKKVGRRGRDNNRTYLGGLFSGICYEVRERLGVVPGLNEGEEVVGSLGRKAEEMKLRMSIPQQP